MCYQQKVLTDFFLYYRWLFHCCCQGNRLKLQWDLKIFFFYRCSLRCYKSLSSSSLTNQKLSKEFKIPKLSPYCYHTESNQLTCSPCLLTEGFLSDEMKRWHRNEKMRKTSVIGPVSQKSPEAYLVTSRTSSTKIFYENA